MAHYEVIEDQAEVIREIFDRYTRQLRILERLRGISTKGGLPPVLARASGNVPLCGGCSGIRLIKAEPVLARRSERRGNGAPNHCEPKEVKERLERELKRVEGQLDKLLDAYQEVPEVERTSHAIGFRTRRISRPAYGR